MGIDDELRKRSHGIGLLHSALIGAGALSLVSLKLQG